MYNRVNYFKKLASTDRKTKIIEFKPKMIEVKMFSPEKKQIKSPKSPEKKNFKKFSKDEFIQNNKLLTHKKSVELLQISISKSPKINHKLELPLLKGEKSLIFQKENDNDDQQTQSSYRSLFKEKIEQHELNNSPTFDQPSSSNISNMIKIEDSRSLLSLDEKTLIRFEKAPTSSRTKDNLEDTIHSTKAVKNHLYKENLQKTINETLNKYQLTQSFWGKWMDNKKHSYSNYDLLGNIKLGDSKLDESIEIKKFEKEYE